jgi:hypothetical protein
MRWLACVLAVVSIAGCVETDPFDVELGGKADDGAGFPLIEAGPDQTLDDLEVSAVGTDRERLVLVRVHLEAGDSLIATMRATSPGLDSYLLLKGTDSEILDESDSQALLPMARESDALVAYTARAAGPVFLFAAGGPDLETGGRFRVDLIGLDADPAGDLSITHAGLRAINQDLRSYEPELADYVEREALAERADGLIEVNAPGFKELALSERARVNQLEAAINSTRALLFRELGSDPVGPAVAEVWAQLRR